MLTQQDPIGLAGGLNLYGFSGGDPVNFGDPFGLCTPMPECWYQAAANWGARRGGPLGRYVLNVAAVANGLSEAGGVNRFGEQLGSGDVEGAASTAMMMFLVPGEGAAARFSQGQLGAVERTLAADGAAAVGRSLRKWERRLTEHLGKRAEILARGGNANSVEREIRNFEGLINAAKQVLGIE